MVELKVLNVLSKSSEFNSIDKQFADHFQVCRRNGTLYLIYLTTMHRAHCD